MPSTTADTTTETRRCLRCRHTIRSAEALATGYGKGCRAKVRKAAAVADLSAWTGSQIEDARELIEDGGVVPSARRGVFHVVSSDGAAVYLTHPDGCNCAAGLKTRQPRPCLHRCAAVIVLAANAARPATRPLILAA